MSTPESIKTLVEFLFMRLKISTCPEKFRELYRGFPRMSTRKIPGCFSHFHTITRLSLPDLISLFAIWTAARSFRFGSSTHHIAHHLQCQDILCSLAVRPCLSIRLGQCDTMVGPQSLSAQLQQMPDTLGRLLCRGYSATRVRLCGLLC